MIHGHKRHYFDTFDSFIIALPPPVFDMSSEVALRSSKLPAGSLFPVESDTVKIQVQLLEDITMQYMLNSVDNKLQISYVDYRKDRGVYTPIPIHYDDLVRRFLWRIDVLTNIFRKRDTLSSEGMTDEIDFAVSCNLRYALDVLKFCRPAFREAAEQSDEVRIAFFDAYMLEEHFVGRHEPSAVILWQRDHPTQNLRHMDVFALGE